MEKIELKSGDVLEKKVIKVRAILRPRPFFKDGHDGQFMYTGCNRVYGLPYNTKTRSYFNPFLKEGEQQFFENALNRKDGDLNLYNYHSKFWGTFTITLNKDGDELDLKNPSDALLYRIMLANPKFANNIEEKDNLECEFYLVDEALEEKAITQKAEQKDRAMDYMYKLKKSKKAMFNTLRLLGKKPDKTASTDWFKTELYKILDQTGNVPGVVGMKQFIQVMEDPTAETKIFVLDAIEEGEIVQGAEGFRISDNRKYLGKDLQSLYDYFIVSSPEAKEEKILIEQRLKKN